MQLQRNSVPTSDKFFTRREYQEILLARMAGGDLYANEERLRLRRVDMMLDRLRVACGAKALYATPPNLPCGRGLTPPNLP